MLLRLFAVLSGVTLAFLIDSRQQKGADARGRLWVIESHSYPHWITDGKKPGKDRVLVYQRDGAKWKQTVFLKDGVNLSGIAVGFGGVWLASVPKIVFIPTDLDKLKAANELIAEQNRAEVSS